MIRFPCKYQRTMVSIGFKVVQDFVHPQTPPFGELELYICIYDACMLFFCVFFFGGGGGGEFNSVPEFRFGLDLRFWGRQTVLVVNKHFKLWLANPLKN